MFTKNQRKKLVIIPIIIITLVILWTGLVVVGVNITNNESTHNLFCEKWHLCPSKEE